MPRWVFALVQFFPLSLFSAYAFWSGAPSNQRWLEAFQLAALAGILQLVFLFRQSNPANRLVLGGNLYLILGGMAALTHQWWYLQLYDRLRESAIFFVMFVVGVVATLATKPGFVASNRGAASEIRRASFHLLLANAVCLLPAVVFEGNRLWSAIVPIIALALLQRRLALRLDSRASAAVD